MNIEDIKVGETYNVRVQVSDYCDGIIFCRTVIDIDPKDGLQCGEEYEIYHDEVSALSPINPYPPLNLPKMTEIPETYPKYDPNRKFRKGDKVRVKREVHGRPVYIGEDAWEPLDPNEIWEVVEEKETGWVHLKNGCLSADVWHGMLELVTPAEELEPYSVGESTDYFSVEKDDEELSLYWKDKHPNAKVAAEAERDRLNAEYRKEQRNDS